MNEPVVFQSRGHVAVLISNINCVEWLALVYERPGSMHVRAFTGSASSENAARDQASDKMRAMRKIDEAPYLRAITKRGGNVWIVGVTAGCEKRWSVDVLRLRDGDSKIEIFCSTERKSAREAESLVTSEVRRALGTIYVPAGSVSPEQLTQ